MTLVSIIIPAYNAENTLAACLEACSAQTHPEIEVIVVDDGSRDGTARIAGDSAGIRYLHQKNRGPAAARNLGAREARGEILAFTDSDCVPHPDWIEHLLTGFDEGVAAVGGTYGIGNPEHLLARLVHQEILCRHARFSLEVDFLGSFNVACRRTDFETVGGFDESFREASGEDNDLAYRLHDIGKTLRFVPESVVVHYHPERLLAYLRTQARHGFWRVKLYSKHPGRTRGGDRYAGLADLLAPVLALAAVAALPFAAAFSALFPYGPAVWSAWCALALLPVLLHLPLTLRLRRAAGRIEMLSFAGLAVLRDLARAWGMLRGVWRFQICGEKNRDG